MQLKQYREILLLSIFISCFLVYPAFGATIEQTGTAPDAYEVDDTFSQATVIVLNDEEPQHHNFHKAGDQDWVKFYGIAEEAYTIKASNLGTKCDAVLDLYNSDGATLIKSRDDGKEGMDEVMDWICPQAGIYYVKVRQYNPDIFGEGTEYDLSVYRPIGPPTGCISGTVTVKTSKEPVDGAIIWTTCGSSTISVMGYYLIINPPGICTMTVSAPGYVSFESSVTVNSGECTNFDITLTSESAPSTCPIESLYGEHSKETELLRYFRDTVLSKTPEGQKIIKLYYQWSPVLIKMMGGNEEVKDTVKAMINRVLPLIESSTQAAMHPH